MLGPPQRDVICHYQTPEPQAQLLSDVAEGVVYVDGERVKRGIEKAAA